MTEHKSVLLKEAVDALGVKPGGWYVDGTFGRGGHSMEIARRGGNVLGIDRDVQALDEWRERVASGATEGLAGKIDLIHGLHGDLAEMARKAGLEAVDGILLDLGVSSPQLDEAERGFSFMKSGPLDMRMDATCGETAEDVVNGRSEEELERLLREYGGERQARRIAKAIAKARESRRIADTLDLAEIVSAAAGGRRGRIHPATRTFQALRMAVNDEIGELERALEGGFRLLRPGGRFAVIAFESDTARIVKKCFAEHTGRDVALPQGGVRHVGASPRTGRQLTVKPGAEEIAVNPRSRSAVLKVVEVTKEG